MNKQTQTQSVHHGDISLWAIEAPTKAVIKAARVVQSGGTSVLALGERTGHRHELRDCSEIITADGQRLVFVLAPSEIVHAGGDQPDHAVLPVAEGWYLVNQTREYRRGQIVIDRD